MSVTINSDRRGAALLIANEELATIREAMRELNRMVEALERGELEKVVLTQRNRMRAVLVSVERFAELEHRAADVRLDGQRAEEELAGAGETVRSAP